MSDWVRTVTSKDNRLGWLLFGDLWPAVQKILKRNEEIGAQNEYVQYVKSTPSPHHGPPKDERTPSGSGSGVGPG